MREWVTIYQYKKPALTFNTENMATIELPKMNNSVITFADSASIYCFFNGNAVKLEEWENLCSWQEQIKEVLDD